FVAVGAAEDELVVTAVRTSTDPQEMSACEQKVVGRERHLAMHSDIVSGTKRDDAFMGDRIECRDAKLTEIVDTQRSNINAIGARMCARQPLTEFLDSVVAVVEVEDERVVAASGIPNHRLGVAPQVVISGATDQVVVSAPCVAGHRLRVPDENALVGAS